MPDANIMSRVMDSNIGTIVISVILGLGIASLFRKVCRDRNCITCRKSLIEGNIDDNIIEDNIIVIGNSIVMEFPTREEIINGLPLCLTHFIIVIIGMFCLYCSLGYTGEMVRYGIFDENITQSEFPSELFTHDFGIDVLVGIISLYIVYVIVYCICFQGTVGRI